MQAPTSQEELDEVMQAAAAAAAAHPHDDIDHHQHHEHEHGGHEEEEHDHHDEHAVDGDGGAHPEQDLLDFYQQHAHAVGGGGGPDTDAAVAAVAAAFQEPEPEPEQEGDMGSLEVLPMPNSFDGAYQTQRRQQQQQQQAAAAAVEDEHAHDSHAHGHPTATTEQGEQRRQGDQDEHEGGGASNAQEALPGDEGEDGGMALEAMRLASQQQRELEYAYGVDAVPSAADEEDEEQGEAGQQQQQQEQQAARGKRGGKRKLGALDDAIENSGRSSVGGPSSRPPRNRNSIPGPNTKRARQREQRALLESTIVPGSDGMTEADVRSRQARSRASGRVLARGNACEFCKRRKLRCDGARPACDHCAKKPGRVCVYNQRKPVPKLRAMQERLAELEAALGLSKTDPRDHELLIKQRDEVGEMIRRHPPAGDEGGSERDAKSEEPMISLRRGSAVPEDHQVVAGGEDGEAAAAAAGADEADVFAAAAGMMGIVVPPMPLDTSTMGVTHDDDHADDEGPEDVAVEDVQMDDIEARVDDDGTKAHDENDVMVQDTNPDLMTLANAAEVAGEPTTSTTTTSAAAAKGDLAATTAGSPTAPPTSLPNLEDYVPFQKPLPQPIAEISPAEVIAQIDSHLSGQTALESDSPAAEVKRELDGVFARKAADMLGYTRAPSVAALETDLGSFPPKLCKSLAYAALTASAFLVASVPKLAVRMRRQDLPELGRRFLVAAQREIAIASQSPSTRIDTVQAYEIVATVLLGQNRPFEAWLFAGQGLRLAVACGLHRLEVGSVPAKSSTIVADQHEQLDERLAIDPELQQSISPYEEQTLLMSATAAMPELGASSSSSSAPGNNANQRSERETQLRRLYPKRTLVSPPTTLAELGDRMHVFWSLIHIERVCSLYQGWPTSLSNAEITTPWPRPIEEYLNGTATHHESLHELFEPQPAASPGLDTGLILVLKSTTLLAEVWSLFDFPEHSGSSAPSSPRLLKHAQLRFNLDAFVATLPEAYREAPSTGRHRRAFHSPSVWLHLCIETMRLVLGSFENIYSNDDDSDTNIPPAFQEDETLLEIAERIVKLSRTINAPDFPKAASPTYGPLWSITGRFLARVCQHHWDTGKTEGAKKMGEILKGLTDVIRNFARVYPIGTEIRHKFDLMIQKDQDFLPGAEWDRAGVM